MSMRYVVLGLATACGAPPAPPGQPAAPATPAEPAPAAAAAADADPTVAQKAAKVALEALSKRNFDTAGCAAAEARVVSEAEARAGVPATESQCAVLAARAADGTWLIVVRSMLSSKSVGAQARVTVTANAEGLGRIEYAR